MAGVRRLNKPPDRAIPGTPVITRRFLAAFGRRITLLSLYVVLMMSQFKSTSWTNQGEFLTVRELADRLKVSAQTVRNWTKARAITPALKRKRVVRYNWDHVARDLGIQHRSTIHPAFEEVPQ